MSLNGTIIVAITIDNTKIYGYFSFFGIINIDHLSYKLESLLKDKQFNDDIVINFIDNKINISVKSDKNIDIFINDIVYFK